MLSFREMFSSSHRQGMLLSFLCMQCAQIVLNMGMAAGEQI